MPTSNRPPAVTAAVVLLAVVGADAVLAGIWFAGTLALGNGGPRGCFFCGVCPGPILIGAEVLRKAVRLWNGGVDDAAGVGGACLVFGAICLPPVAVYGYDVWTLWRETGWASSERRLREWAIVAVAALNAVALMVAGGLLRGSGRRYAAWKDESPDSVE